MSTRRGFFSWIAGVLGAARVGDAIGGLDPNLSLPYQIFKGVPQQCTYGGCTFQWIGAIDWCHR